MAAYSPGSTLVGSGWLCLGFPALPAAGSSLVPLAAGQWRPAERGAARAAAGAPQLGTGSGERRQAASGASCYISQTPPAARLASDSPAPTARPRQGEELRGGCRSGGKRGAEPGGGIQPLRGSAQGKRRAPLRHKDRGSSCPAGRSRTEARFHGQSCAAAQNGAGLGHLLKFESTASFYTQEKCYA